MRNSSNVWDEWSWLNCSELEFDKCVKFEHSGIEFLRKIENS